MVKFVPNLELERKKLLKKIEEEYDYSNFHKFTPFQLFKFLEPISHKDSLRLLHMLIKRAQIGAHIVTRKMFKSKYGSYPSKIATGKLMEAGIISETLGGAYTLTMKVNEYAEILSMMQIGDKAPEIVHLSNYNYIRIEKRDVPSYCAVTNRGAVLKESLSLSEIKDFVNEYIGKREKGDKYINYIKNEDIEDLLL